jgi:uncharacterized protein (DUF305 family)
VNSRGGLWTTLGILSLTLIGGTLAVFSAAASLEGAGGAEPTRASLMDAILCAFTPDGASAGFAAEMASAHARMHRTMDEIQPTGDPDRDFAHSMIPHHQGAIDMALIQLKHGRDERLRRLAQAIIVEQGQEIAYLRAILDAPLGSNTPARMARQ